MASTPQWARGKTPTVLKMPAKVELRVHLKGGRDLLAVRQTTAATFQTHTTTTDIPPDRHFRQE